MGPLRTHLTYCVAGPTVTMRIPDDKVGLVIGKAGQTIGGIQTRTGAHIQIPPQADNDNPTVR